MMLCDATTLPDYKKYSKLCRMGQKLVNLLKQMDPRDPFRIEMTDALLEKLYNMAVIPSRKSLALCDRLSVSSFCRRRLSTVLVQLKFAEHLKEAVTYIDSYGRCIFGYKKYGRLCYLGRYIEDLEKGIAIQ